jgi:2'-5' RNA ligase
MEEIRSFIAVALPREVTLALTRLQEQLKTGGRTPAKWVDPASIHLTLKFLGNTSAGLTGRITAAMTEATRGTAPIRLEVKGVGAFPNLNRVQIVWVGLTGETDRLAALQKAIEAGLKPLGFAPEARPFTPHLTLARLRDQATPAERQQLGRLIAATDFAAGGFPADAIHLMRSQLTPAGPIYSRLSSVELK